MATKKSGPSIRSLARRVGWVAPVAAALLLLSAELRAVSEVSSYALVHDDATLQVAGRQIRLSGVYLPDTGRVCGTHFRPVRCGSRAAQALRFKIRGFVSCSLTGKYADGSYAAYCRVEDEDLGLYLIDRGWALAAPQAPFPYHAHERIARQRGMGVWGFQVDTVSGVR
ncbi:MAG: nuclease-like protein [Gammaproteobacteria bacterium]|nr:nuclease-like protein [Gammaproteobacteria bacterium]